MAVGRQLNVKGQMRIDVPHLRLIESGVVYDFDTLAGGILAGKLPYVVTGFVPATWVGGSAASSLSLVTADSIFVNYQASENGSMLMVPADRAPEQLTITNSRVSGNFTVSQTNYISLDLTRTEDSTTSDVVHFIDPATSQGTPKIIPLGRTMDYQIHITTSPFSNNPQRCPVMIVVTDAANNIVSVVDARPMMFRLAAGGDTPSALSKYAWPEGRNVGVTPANESALFTGGDKAIGDMKSWISAVEEMIWQINAGEYWYSNTTMSSTWFMPGAVTDWTWNGTTLAWANPITIVFSGSTAITNTIAAGSINLSAGNAAYVDFNRYTNGAVLTVYQAAIQTMGGEPVTPGIRYPFAWRTGATTPAIRNLPVPAGSSVVGIATTTTAGSVKINSADANPYAVISTALGGRALATGLQRPSGTGALDIGTTTNETSITIGGGVNNQTVIIGFASATLGTTAVYGKILVLGIATGSAQMNTGNNQIGCTLGASTSIGVNSDATVNINTGASITAATQIGTAAKGSLGMYALNAYLNDAGAACQTTIGHDGAGIVTTISGRALNLNTSGIGNTTIGNATGGDVAIVTGTGVHFISLQGPTAGTAIDMNNTGISITATGLVVTINTTGTGQTYIGNNTGSTTIGGTTTATRARAASATLSGDNALTLVTKGFLEGVDASWVGFTPLNGTWATYAGRAFSYKLHNGILYFRGALTPGASAVSYVGDLPVGFRPSGYYLALLYFTSSGAALNGAAVLDINPTNGNVNLYRPNAVYGATWQIPQTGDVFEMVGSFPVS